MNPRQLLDRVHGRVPSGRGARGAGDARGAEERPGPTSLSGRALVQMRRGSAVAAPNSFVTELCTRLPRTRPKP